MPRRPLLLETCEDRILCSATPSVTLQAPANAKIGDAITVRASFSNASGTNAGYGPYIDLLIDKTGADGNDGLNFTNASYLGQAVTSTVLTFDAALHATHPYAKDSAGNPLVITAPAGYQAGDQLIVLQLPFGSFTPQQPAATVDINLTTNNLTDAGTALPLAARGGFQYGNDALNNPTTDPSIVQGSYSNATITPTLFTLTKTYIGPENETATGSNYLRQYQIDVDIAAGQTITNLQLSDLLPAGMQFFTDATHQVEVLANGSATSSTATSTPSGTTPGGTLTRTISSVTGDATTAPDATLRFWFYVPRIDSGSAAVVDATTGNDTTSGNNASTSGNWTPVDVRDSATAVSLNAAGPEHTLTNKSIATQKTVATITDAGVAGLSPGDVLEYTIQVQVSDYFAFNNLVLTDLLSDGQHIDQSFTPTFITTEHGGGVALGGFDADNWTASQNWTSAVANGPTYTLDPAANDGTTTITFRLSDEMITRGTNADLVGGGIPNGGGAVGNNPPLPFGATTATIKFRVIVQDTYSDKPADPQLSPRDVITNNVTVSGDLLRTNNLTANGNSEADTSGTTLTVAQPTLTKTVYAINGTLVGSATNLVIRPGDLVTYRLQYTVPTGDINDFYLTDFLPLPVFDTSTFNLTYSSAAPSATAPGANIVQRGPTDNFTSITGLAPTVTEPGGNTVQFNYGSYSNTSNTTLTADVLFTVVVNAQPFADGLFLTNQARATEGIARTGVVDTDAIVQFNLGEPDVSIYKGVVGRNTSGTTLGGIVFNAPTATANFTGTIDTTAEVTAIDAANGTAVDAGDTVRFAVVARNIGRSDAYDVSVTDRILTGYDLPPDLAALNLVVRRGNGGLLVEGTDYNATYNNATGQFTVTLIDNYASGVGTGGLNLGKTDASGTATTDGSNVLVIMYDATLADDVRSNAVLTNTATLTDFSNVDGGTDFTTINPTATATVTTTAPTVVKQSITTEIIDTRGNGQYGAVIGELATYTLTITVPEGTLANAILTDTLDSGLSLVSVDSIISSSGVTYTGTPFSPAVSNGGRTVAYNLGTITNTNSSNGAAETITITYRAVVLDVASNQGGVNLGSSGASLAYQTTDQPSGSNRNATATAAAPTQKIAVVEPTVNTTVSATVNGVANGTGDAGDPVVYTITLAHAGGSADAFDVDLSDLVPALVNVTGFTVNDSSGLVTSSSFSLTGNTLSTVSGGFDFANVAGRTLTITISGTYANAIAAGVTITNSATTRWTSMDGTVAARSSYDGTSLERTGADGLPGAGILNDYRSTGSVILTTTSIPTKSVVSTSESGTSGSNVTPGEVIRYRLVMRIGEGDTDDVRFLDSLPAGLMFLNDNTARVAFVSAAGGITSSTLSGAGLSVTGDETTLSGITPTFLLPNSAISASSSTDDDTYTAGTDVYFKLGDLSVADRDANQEFVVVEFNAIVSNSAASSDNTSAGNGSDAGDTNSNTFTTYRDTSVAIGTSNSANVTVVEPNVSIAKAILTTPTDAGDTVRYTITLTNANTAATSAAYDLLVRDLLDNDISLTSVTDSLSRGSLSTSLVGGQTQIDYTISSLNVGETIVITVTGTLKADASAGESLGNAATLTYTSLPGSGTAGNPTGSNAGASGSATGERTGSGTAPNDYAGTSNTVNIVLAQPTIDKLDLTKTTYAVGEQVIYFLNITLPEGVTENLSINEFIPAGLTPLSFDVIRNGSATGTTTTPSANFAGSGISNFHIDIPNPVDGGGFSLSLGNVTTTADNNASNNNFLIRVVAVVSDAAAATNGATLSNLGQLTYRVPTDSASSNPSTGSTASSGDTTNVTVIEPKLQIIKSVSDTTPEIGETLTYTLTISHAAGSTATAYDLILRDLMPAGLTLVPGSLTFSTAPGSNSTTTSLLDLTFDQLAVGQTLTITYQATVSQSQSTVGQTLDNNARLYWDTLVGDDANAVLTGSGDGTPDRDYGPTSGVEAPTPGVDDPAQDTERVTVNAHQIQGVVYQDTNANGTLSAGEPRLQNVKVSLSGTDLNGNAVNIDVFTDASGLYTFTNLPAGTYTITEEQPATYVDARETVGSNYGGTVSSALDSNTISGVTIANDGAATGTGYNFGETANSVIRGTAYIDTDNDGLVDAPESRLPNVAIRLTGTDVYGQSVLIDTITDTNGDYAFTGLRPGTYTVTETQPVGYFDGRETAGTGSTTPGTVNNSTNSNTISSIVLGGGQTSTGNLFGELPAASLSGTVYRDLDNDGTVESGEAGLPNVTVTLTGLDDRNQPVSLSMLTDVDGNYSFLNLRPGTYTITETQPAGLLDGRETAGGGVLTPGSVVNAVDSNTITNIALGAGQSGANNNFGELPPSSLQGTVYRDDNLNGLVDSGEMRLGNVALQLTGTNDRGQSVNLSVTTAADGTYQFLNLRPGTYTISETQPAGYVDARDTAGTAGGTVANPPGDSISAITLPSNTDGLENNFGELNPASLTGRVFNDRNNNGTQEAGEGGLSGVSIRLTGTDTFGNNVDVTVTTDGNGDYSFNGLAPSNAAGYTLTETQPGAYLDGRETAGTAGGVVNSATNSQTISGIVLNQGVTSSGNNFAEIQASTLSGLVYRDLDNDGINDGGAETPVAGVTVTLTGTDDRGQIVNLSTLTDATGAYSFSGLRPSDSSGYTFTETQPSGLLDGQNTVGTQGGSTQNNPLTDVIVTVPVVPGTSGSGNNFGELPPASLSGTVFRDDNNDGTKQGAEPPLANVTITVTGTDDLGNSVNLTTTTDSAGLYSFGNLRPGTYTITETQPAGYLDGRNTVGSTGGSTLEGNPLDVTSGIVLAAGNTGTGYNFGELTSSSISGRVYVDANNNGTVDSGETLLSGVSVTLTGTDDLGANVSLTLLTDLNGNYSFDGLRPGVYTLTEAQPSGYLDGRNTLGSLSGTTSNNPLSDVISAITLPSNSSGAGYNFGELAPSSLTGRVYLDLNGNGSREAAEAGVPNVTVTLTGVNDLGQAINLTVLTDSAGAYTFTNLRPSAAGYTITETQPANYLDGADQIGTQGGTAGNDVLSTGNFVSGTNGTGNDFTELLSTQLGKTILSTSEGSTTGAQVAVGETVRYQLTVTVPYGTLQDFQVQELLPSGLVYVADGTATLVLGSGLTADTFAISSSSTVADNTYASGSDVYFKLGNLTNSDTDAASLETITIAFTARVVDQPTNVSSTVLGNQFAIRFDSTGDGVAEDQPQGGVTPPVNVTVVEPQLHLTKSVDDSTPDIGQRVTFTLTIAHTAASTQDAFDLLLRDAMPAGLTLDPLSLRVNGALVGSASTSTGVSLDLASLNLGDTVTITYEATVDNTLGNVGGTLLNNARLYWDSLPADETNAVLDNSPDGTPDRDYGARPGYVESNSPSDDDGAQDTQQLQVNSNSITGNVFRDNDYSGTRSAGDTRLAGVTIQLTGTTATGLNVTLTTVTSAAGVYTFTGLAAGNYTLAEIQPAGYVDGLETAGTPSSTFGGTVSDVLDSNTISSIVIPAQSNTTEAEYNFAETLASSLAGNVYLDDDNDGVRDAGEAGVGSVPIRLTGTDVFGQSVVLDGLTNPDGTYSFGNLRPGTYTVTENDSIIVPSPYLDGRDTAGSVGGDASLNNQVTAIIVGQNTNATGYNFGELRPGSLTGSVYLDANNDGTRGATEAGISGVTVTLSGVNDLGEQVSVQVATSADGTYLFDNLRPGSYTLTETQPAAYADGKDGAGSLGGVLANDQVSSIAVQAGQNGTGYNFGERLTGLTGQVYLDANKDGLKQVGESGLGGVTLTLRDHNGVAVATTVSNPDGTFSFSDLLAGNYTVEETQPTGYGSSTPNGAPVTVTAGVSPTVAFGETLGSLAGSVYFDADKSGSFTPGETGLGGVLLTLTGTADDGSQVTRTTTTAGDGSYIFQDLLSGTYALAQTQPAGYTDGAETLGTAGGVLTPTDSITQVALGAGVDATGYQFGETITTAVGRGAIAGVVYYDRNANGAIDGAESGLGNISLTLRDNLGNVVATTTTGADGSYAFANLLPGQYTVTQQQPAAYGSSTPNTISAINVIADSVTGSINFGETSGSLGGAVYFDRNNNGQRDAGEKGIAGVTVQLQGTDYNGAAVTRSLVTDDNGDYLFTELLGGTYSVTETQPAGVADGADAAGTAGGVLGNDVVNNIGLGGGISATGYNFGERPAAISGTVYLDGDRNATRGVGETGLGGVTLHLLDTNGQEVATTVTAADGSYSFEGIAPGAYTVLETQPAGYGSSTGNALTVTVPAGGLTGQDFGETAGSVGGRVYLDANHDGIYNPGENGLGGVQVILTGLDANNAPVNTTTTTAADGSYLFDGLLAGSYTVRETQPSGYQDGGDTLGSSGGTNSANDEFSGIGLGGGTQATGYNFGEELATPAGTGAITGTVYIDRNRNQALEGGEGGITGVTLSLLDQNGALVATTQTDADGSFVFNGITVGTGYQIVEQQPAGYGSSTPDLLTGITVLDGQVAGNQNFGETLATLRGTVYLDRDANGSSSAGDTAIAGVTVNLTGTDINGLAISRQVISAADGSYVFDDLLAGDYTITESQPASYLDGSDAFGSAGGDNTVNDTVSNIAIAGGSDVTGYNFGELGAEIRGVVFHDRNRDGIRDAGEAPVANVPLQLLDAQGQVVATVTTAPDGSYSFSNLPLGDYTVVETQPAAYGSSTTNNVPVTLSTPTADVNFGETLGSLTGTVYVDRNANGLRDAGEPPLGNVTVTLSGVDINGNQVSQTTVTDGLGQYQFEDLAAGTYSLTETQPAGYIDGANTAGTAGGNTTQPNAISGIGLGAGNNVTDYLFGERSQVDLVVTKDDGQRNVKPGETITYTVTLRNAGLQEANGVLVSDQFPHKLLDFVSASNGGIYDPVTNTITWQLGQITGNNEEVITLTITATVKRVIPAGSEKLTNIVTVQDDGSAGLDLNPLDNTAKDVDRVKASPDLYVTKTDNLTEATVGQQVTYVIAGGNAGHQVAGGVVVSDTLPPGVRFVSASNGGRLVNGQVVWNLGDVRPGQTFSLTVTVVVEVPAAATTLTNSVTITDRYNNFEDPTPENNMATDLTSVPALPVEDTFFFAFDSFQNFSADRFMDDEVFDSPLAGGVYHNPTDNYRPALLPLAPIYSGEADPGATLVIVLYNANGDRIGEETVVVDAGGNWMATFASSEVRDYPASVSIVELPAPYSGAEDSGRNLRNFFAPALNPGQFSFGGQNTPPLDPRATAPLLGSLNLERPIDLGTTKYNTELLPSAGAPGGR